MCHSKRYRDRLEENRIRVAVLQLIRNQSCIFLLFLVHLKKNSNLLHKNRTSIVRNTLGVKMFKMEQNIKYFIVCVTFYGRFIKQAAKLIWNVNLLVACLRTRILRFKSF